MHFIYKKTCLWMESDHMNNVDAERKKNPRNKTNIDIKNVKTKVQN